MKIWMALVSKNDQEKHQFINRLDSWLSEMSIQSLLIGLKGDCLLCECKYTYKSMYLQRARFTQELDSLLVSEGCFGHDLLNDNVNDMPTEQVSREAYKMLLTNPEKVLSDSYGDFTLALLRENEQEIIVANDIYATRPVYYYVSPDQETVCISNDLRVLFLVDSVPFEIDVETCLLYPTTYHTVNENEIADRTFFKQIHRLPPASTLTWKNNRLEIKKYWSLQDNFNNQIIPEAMVTTRFREIMIDVAKQRLSNDKTMLEISGGLDSSNVLAALVASGYNSSIFGINLSFKDKDIAFGHDRKIVTQLLETLNISGAIVLGENTARIPNAELGRDPLWHIDGPDPRANPFCIEVFGAIGKEMGIERALTGEGGDFVVSGTRYVLDSMVRGNEFSEVFDIMKKSHDGRLRNLFQMLYRFVIAPFIPILNEKEYYRYLWHEEEMPMDYFTKEQVERDKSLIKLEEKQIKNSRFLKRWGWRYHYDYLYPRARYLDVSRTCVQFLHPFYDRRLLEFSFQVLPEHHFNFLEGHYHGAYKGSKQMLRNAFRDILPDNIINRVTKTSYAHMARKRLLNEKKNLLQLFSSQENIQIHDLGIVNKDKFRDHLIASLIRSEDPNNDLGVSYQFLRSTIDLEIWLREMSRGKEYILDRSKPRNPRWLAEVEFIGDFKNINGSGNENVY